ncbi:universal stress protein [Thalassotalea fusca]
MNMHVLVIADIEDDDFLSLEKARDIAVDISASLEIVKFVHYDTESDGTITEFMENAAQNIQTVISDVFQPDIKVSSKIVLKEDIDEWLVERCQMNIPKIDLVIKGGHRTESFFHTPTDWKLIRHLHCPILIASHEKWKSQANILMALDLSEPDAHHYQLNELTLKWGSIWSGATHTALHALYCIPIAKPLLALDIVDKHDVEIEQAPEAKEELDDFLEQYDMPDTTSHVAAGAPDKIIPHMADELHSDLVIMGCVGREGLSGFFLGNTAEKVLHHIRTDCLIVKLPKPPTT